MRILFLSNVFPTRYEPSRGPFNRELVQALARGHEVRVVCPVSWTDELRARCRIAPTDRSRRCSVADVVEVQYPRYYYPPKVLRQQYTWFLWRSVRFTVQRLLDSFQPECVLGYWTHPDGEVAIRAARLAGVPAVVMVGGSDVLLLTRRRQRRQQVLRVLHEADAVITSSQDLKDRTASLGIEPRKVHVVYRGVDLKRFSSGCRMKARRTLGIASAGKVILWVGRMVPVKGLDVLLQACARLRTANLDYRLYLVGDGPLRSSLEAKARLPELRGCVRFVGALEHSRLTDWYRAADLTVLPSRSEGLPNVLLESLACGTPFVASRVGGIPEIAGTDIGRLVPPDDPGALADSIAWGLRVWIGRTEPRVRLATWSQSAQSVIEVLRPLVARPPVKRSAFLTGRSAPVGQG